MLRSILALSVLALCVTACGSRTGDSCASDFECPQGQTCDTASPGGYCLSFDCEPGDNRACPDDAVCIDFVEPDLTACMRRCDSNRDCRTRDGYVCREDLGPVGFCYLPADEEG